MGILFCDICEFDTVVDTFQEGIIKLLNEIFRTFDIICNSMGV